MRAERAPGLVPVECSDLFRLAEHPDRIPWVPYKPGVEIFRIYGDGVSGPGAVVLRYEKGDEITLHEHVGYEHNISWCLPDLSRTKTASMRREVLSLTFQERGTK